MEDLLPKTSFQIYSLQSLKVIFSILKFIIVKQTNFGPKDKKCSQFRLATFKDFTVSLTKSMICNLNKQYLILRVGRWEAILI
jgi:hypothetical protein